MGEPARVSGWSFRAVEELHVLTQRGSPFPEELHVLTQRGSPKGNQRFW